VPELTIEEKCKINAIYNNKINIGKIFNHDSDQISYEKEILKPVLMQTFSKVILSA
jgi:hypothetical protein